MTSVQVRSLAPRAVLFACIVWGTVSCVTHPEKSTSPGLPAAPDREASVADLNDILTPIIARAGIPGMVAVVLKGDRIVAEGAVGVRRQGSDAAITIEDRFELCSATKSLSATVVARLVEEGLMK